MTFRISSLLALSCALSSSLARPSAAFAQAPAAGGTAHLPLAVDLKKVAIGSWAEYRSGDGQNTVTVRMVLVSRTAKSAEIETHVVGGPLAAMGNVTVRMSIPFNNDSEIKPTEQVIQIRDNAPMLLPASFQGGPAQALKRLDPKERIAVESLSVPAGPFPKAEHYRDKGPGGEAVDYWMSKDVPPLGLVKVAAVAGVQTGTKITMELTAHGKGGKATITQKPIPFDGATMVKEVQSGAGGPPPQQIPSPHPGMPPQTPAGSSTAPVQK